MNDYSYISNADPVAIEALYNQYKSDPNTLDETWKKFFEGFEFASEHSNGATGAPVSDHEKLKKEIGVFGLIQAYRHRAHLLGDTNPIRPRKKRDPALDLHYFDLEEDDMNLRFFAGEDLGMPNALLSEIIVKLRSAYCKKVTIEYEHIREKEIRDWVKQNYEERAGNPGFDLDQKRQIFTKLNEAVVFENFLHRKYTGQKRFSLEGGENTIPALDAIVNRGSELGVKRFAIGMAHRGRLNVLANVLGKTYDYIFSEFEGNTPEDLSFGDGDVKYHLGFSSLKKSSSGEDVYLSLVPNPSHLEAVDSVIQGYVRGKGEMLYDSDFTKIMPVLIHGDAAISGQGVVYEVAQMSQLEGYKTGGTLHFVINNQIGFTTDFQDARSSDYSTAVGKVTGSPILHVNGDDAEAVVFAVEFATEFRQKFQRDVYVDMLCYRKHGHNESDEPKFTQPHLYNLIAKHPDPREVYKTKLIAQGELEAELARDMEIDFKSRLQDRLDMVKQKEETKPIPTKKQQWIGIKGSKPEDFAAVVETGFSKKNLDKIIKAITTVPEGIKPIRKTIKVLKQREELYKVGQIDWALAETLAYGSLLLENKFIRMSGQDVIRGTFSHRHAMVLDEAATTVREGHISLNHIDEGKQGELSIFNSFLSEYAVLGFEYGYSISSPDHLTIWEAQFGDFANGAQVMMDQFISSGESKWKRMSSLVMLLPHGYEGQGPEHSNARPERFLQLAAEHNMIVANCTTPANFFHLLRRQVSWDFRKPLIVMSPKSLLRAEVCRSSVDEITNGYFQGLIDDENVKAKDVKRVLLCTGKIFYDLRARQIAENRKDVAIVRVEQIYPMPDARLDEIYKKYESAEFFWVQEEPKNMGAWTYMFRYEENRFHLSLISRKASASPATGFSKVHEREQEEIISKAFDLN